MRTMYAALNFMHSLRQISLNSSFRDDYLERLRRNIEAIENALDDNYRTKNIKNTKQLAETWEKRHKLFIKSYVCFLINTPNTFKLFDNTKRNTETCLKMFNNTENYRTAVANDKSHAINETIGTIAYE